MPARQQEWAKVEWEFIRFDERYTNLPWGEKDDIARAYMHLWTTCPKIRCDVFNRAVIESGCLANRCGIPQAILLRMVDECVANGLLSRGPGGSVTVDGVRVKHSRLTGWNDKPLRSVMREGESESESESEREGDDCVQSPPKGADLIAKKRIMQEADRIIAFYRTLKPTRDTSRPRATKGVISLLRAGISFEALYRCIVRYKKQLAAEGTTEDQFKKNAGNFFGRDEVYRDFLSDDWTPPEPQKPPTPPQAPAIINPILFHHRQIQPRQAGAK